jgi:hypothetical protein
MVRLVELFAGDEVVVESAQQGGGGDAQLFGGGHVEWFSLLWLVGGLWQGFSSGGVARRLYWGV